MLSSYKKSILKDIFKLAQRNREDSYLAPHSIELLKLVLKYCPKHPDALFQLGICYQFVQRFDLAEKYLKQALDLFHPRLKGWVCLAIGSLYKDREYTYEAKQWKEKGIIVLNNKVSICIWNILGAHNAQLGDFSQAMQAYRNALDPEKCESKKSDSYILSETYFNIGLLSRAMGNYDDCRDAYDKAHELDPDASNILEAINELDEMEKLNPLILELKKIRESQQKINPPYLEEKLDSIMNLAKEEIVKVNRELGVVHLLEEYIIWRTDDWEAFYLLGEALSVIGRFDQSKQTLEKALDLCPVDERFNIFAQMAYLERFHVNPESAEVYFNQAIELKPKAFNILMERGKNFIFLNDLTSAKTCFEQVVESRAKNPTNSEAFCYLARIEIGFGKYDSAVSYLEKAIDLDLNNNEAVQWLKSLKSINETLIYCREKSDKLASEDL